ncbi:DUF6730 family protein, partial [Flagellimonas flava]
MKKMDDIMELFMDEINGFQKSIEKLEVLSKSLNEIKVKADTSNMEWHLKENLKKQEIIHSESQLILREIDKKLKRAKLIPKWLLVFILSALILLSAKNGHSIPPSAGQSEPPAADQSEH